MAGQAKKVGKKMDQKQVLSPPPVLDPLQIDHVVYKIMTFLNVKDLKSARLVCKLWRVEGGERILIKSHLCPKFNNNSDELTEEELLNFLSLVKPAAMFKLFGHSHDIFHVLETFPEFAEKVKELKCKTATPFETKYVVDALEKVPQLEVLETNALYLSPFVFPMENYNGELVDLTIFDIDKFLDKLESLKDIRLDFTLNFNTPNSQSIIEHGSRLKNVSKIKLDKPDVRTMSFLNSEELDWPLNHVTLRFGKTSTGINADLIRDFFVKNGETLKVLDIEMLIKFKNAVTPTLIPIPTAQKLWVDDWLIPVDFPVLETMIISGSEDNIWSLLTIALRLPQLKKLVLARVPDRIDKKIYKWEKDVLAAGKKLQSLSIEQVELNHPTKYSSFVVLTGKLWPNLKCLKVNLHNSSTILASHLFSCWERLERLELNFCSIKSSEFALYQEWLMGGKKCPWNYEKGSVIVKATDISSASPASKLVDLKNLKSLSFHLPLKSFVLGDFLVYNCLQFMKNLQSLRFHGQTSITVEALDELKNAVGEIVSFLDEE